MDGVSAAWHGRVGMQEAKWTDKEGSTVTFRLPMDPLAETKRNPFQKFTKRRKGHAGTRFMMACHVMQGEHLIPVYEDEAMLAGWNDSQSTGHTVKFWLCGDVLGHPFEGFDRKLDTFIVSLAEIDDDETIIDQKMRDRVEQGRIAVTERTSYVAAMLCKNKVFQRWLTWKAESITGEIETEEQARKVLCDVLDIKSRSELDKNQEKAQAFHQRFRIPFLEYNEGAPF